MDSKQPNVGLSIGEIRLLDEPIDGSHLPPVKSKRGRKRSGKYVEYHEAKIFIQGELIQSRTKYYEWWERHKPKDIPKYPYRAYQLDWESWNIFLGNENTFGAHNIHKWRPYDEAVIYVHSLNIPSYAEWLIYCKEEDKLPEDIPARPDLVYPNWRTWNHWLGNKPVEALEAKRESDGRSQVYYIIHENGVPENVLTFGLEPNGISGFKDRWDREQFTIIRAFWYNREEADYINQVVTQLSSKYLGEDRQRIVPNYWEIIYYIEQKLDRVNLKAAHQTTAALKRSNGIDLL